MDGSPTAGVLIITTRIPPFPVDDNNHRSIDLSPLEFILALIAIITIPALIYAFFYSIRCPSDPFGSGRRRSSGRLSDTETVTSDRSTSKEASNSDVKYPKEDDDEHVKELTEGECPICLSAYLDDEELKKLSVCKHLFHVSCIDKWLDSHSDCPVCRAGVEPPVKRSNGSTASAAGDRGDDLQQGLPDASSLV